MGSAVVPALDEGVVGGASRSRLLKPRDMQFAEQRRGGVVDVLRAVVGVEAGDDKTGTGRAGSREAVRETLGNCLDSANELVLGSFVGDVERIQTLWRRPGRPGGRCRRAGSRAARPVAGRVVRPPPPCPLAGLPSATRLCRSSNRPGRGGERSGAGRQLRPALNGRTIAQAGESSAQRRTFDCAWPKVPKVQGHSKSPETQQKVARTLSIAAYSAKRTRFSSD